MYIILFVIIGLCMGSFYLVLGTRVPAGKSIIKPASHCDKCKHKLGWSELIPVVSYIALGGKCKKCHKEISAINLIVELATGLLFGLSYHLYGFSYECFALIVISSLLIIIFVSDFKYLVILDYPLFICTGLICLLKLIYFGFIPFLYAIIGGGLLVLFMLIVKIAGDKVFKREALGWGDVKLSLFMGVALGVRLGLSALIIGSILALPYAGYYVAKKEEKEIPYGPFLIAAVFIVFIFMGYINDFINFAFVGE